MITLRFMVQNNTITQDPACEGFNGLFPGKYGDGVQAAFVFSNAWKKRKKVVAFWSMLGNEYPPRVLNDDNTCEIPKEALARSAFKLQILGDLRGVSYSTDTITIYQRGAIK